MLSEVSSVPSQRGPISHDTQLRLVSRVLTQARKATAAGSGSGSDRQLLGLLAQAQMQFLGLHPPQVPVVAPCGCGGNGAAALHDGTVFARSSTAIAAAESANSSALAAFAAMGYDEFRDLLADPLLLGWVYQLILKERSAAGRAAEVAPEQIGAATQWFTPEWIAGFLVNSCLSECSLETVRFLDPACGAGHLLVAAMRSLAGTDAKQRLPRILSESLFGLDIDPLMLELSAFALYLESRAMVREALELPLPSLFCIGTADGADSLGSLHLAASDLRQLQLFSPWHAAALELSRLPRRFTAIASNPPYLSHRTLPPVVSDFLKKHFPSAQYDLYAAFLSLSVALLEPGGRMAAICQQSFLSIQRYERLRQEIAAQCRIEAVAMLGPGSFAAKAGEKANNAIVVTRKETAGEPGNAGEELLLDGAETIKLWRLLTANEKQLAEQMGLENIRFQQVPRAALASWRSGGSRRLALALWCPQEIERLFVACEPFQSDDTGVVCVNGLFTCDNSRFVKRFSAVPVDEQHLYVPYDKGGGHKWFRTTPYMLRWVDNGAEIRSFRKQRGQSEALPGEAYYFRDGITYSYIGTKGFKARRLSPNAIFDIASSSIFCSSMRLEYLLGFLNSSLCCFMMGVLNPTINFQIGDIRRLP
ncbi:MAG: Eco57I restriction-modification methylase domain-containing protein, partial [Terriglobales bacterium]